jgi:hypothetical protein
VCDAYMQRPSCSAFAADQVNHAVFLGVAQQGAVMACRARLFQFVGQPARTSCTYAPTSTRGQFWGEVVTSGYFHCKAVLVWHDTPAICIPDAGASLCLHSL